MNFIIGIIGIILLTGCTAKIPDLIKPPIIEIKPRPLVIEKESKRIPKPQSQYFCDKIDLKDGSYYGIIDGNRILFYINIKFKYCIMSFDKYQIVDNKCDGTADEFSTHFLDRVESFVRNPPIIIDWKRVDKVLGLGFRLICSKNLNGIELKKLEVEEAFKLFRGIAPDR